jgi:carbon monoxide dehydrogenase subunit G
VPTLQESLLVAASVKRVYGFLADIERVRDWLPYVVDARRTSEVTSGPGAEIELEVSAAGRTSKGTTRCVAAVPSQQLVYETKLALGLTSTVTFDLAPEGRSQTRMDVTVEYGFTGLGRLLGGLLGDKAARRDIVAGLESLKAHIESEAAASRSRRRPTAEPAASQFPKR